MEAPETTDDNLINETDETDETGNTGNTGTPSPPARPGGDTPPSHGGTATNTPGDPSETYFEGKLSTLLGKADTPQESVALWGYPFRRGNQINLYLNLQFTEYLVITSAKGQVGKDDFLGLQDLGNDTFPLAGTVIWVRSSARVRYVRVTNAFQAAGMLQGQIQAAMRAAGTSPLPLMGPGGGPGGFVNFGSHGGCGTGNNTPGCPYYPETHDPYNSTCTGG